MKKQAKQVKSEKIDPATVNEINVSQPKRIFVQRGDTYWLTDPNRVKHHKVLPPGVYTLKITPFGEFFLEETEALEIPEKIYGETVKITQRMLKTYRDRPRNTGILLSGEKGAGKTLMAKVLSNSAILEGIPVILINNDFHGERFSEFLQSITQLCVLMFDEFEKVYDREKQEEMLTLLDGVFNTRKLFVFTCNDKYKIDVNMTNRPGRIFYFLEFKGLDSQFIREYCIDNLKNKSHIDGVVNVSSLFYSFNFDILQSLVEEMNRYSETAIEALKFLNAKPDGTSSREEYTMTLFIDGKKIDDVYESNFYANPVKSNQFSVTQFFPNKRGKKEVEDVEHEFDFNDMESMNVKAGQYIFVRGNARLVMKRKEFKGFELNSETEAKLTAIEIEE